MTTNEFDELLRSMIDNEALKQWLAAVPVDFSKLEGLNDAERRMASLLLTTCVVSNIEVQVMFRATVLETQ
jgi:hypothetical protein